MSAMLNLIFYLGLQLITTLCRCIFTNMLLLISTYSTYYIKSIFFNNWKTVHCNTSFWIISIYLHNYMRLQFWGKESMFKKVIARVSVLSIVSRFLKFTVNGACCIHMPFYVNFIDFKFLCFFFEVLEFHFVSCRCFSKLLLIHYYFI